MVRKLMWFTVGFTVSCVIGAYAVSGVWLLILGLFCLLPLGVLLIGRSVLARKTSCVLIGCVVGFLWFGGFDSLYLAPVRQLDGQTMVLDITVTDYSSPTKSGIKAEGRTQINGKTYNVQFYNNELDAFLPGDRIRGGFRLRYTVGGTDDPTYHRGNGIFLLAYPKGSNSVHTADSVLTRYFASVLRQEILSLIDRLFPEDTKGFAKALMLGYTNDLTGGAKWSLKTSGVYHIVAVSGMHVSILFALVYLLCGRRRVLTALIGFPALFIFAAVAGFSPSIIRACIMQSLIILALLADKEYDPPTALAFAVLMILAANPWSITSVSLQLSAGCMVGIFLFSQRIHDYLLNNTRLGPAKGKSIKAKLIRFCVGSVSVTLGAMIATAPLCAVIFGSISISGILANLLLLWVISIIFYGILAACLFGALWLPVGTMIGWVISWPIRLVLWVTDMISRLPLSAVYTASVYIVAWLIFVYVLLTVFLKSKKKHPVVLTCCLLAGLVGSVLCSWLEPRLDDYRITAVDVGQGQCILLQMDGKHYLVDCGGDSDDLAADRASHLLLSQGIFRLDGLIITHFDADHAGGAGQLLDRVPADTIYLPAFGGESDLRDELIRDYGDKIRWVDEDFQLDEANITIFASDDTQDSNESSLCILFQPENCDILITGDRSADGEQELIEHTELPDLEILIAGHHGSRTSTSWELLNATTPEVVIISVGEDNRYGHPAWETLERLELFGCKVYRTDYEGTIIFRG